MTSSKAASIDDYIAQFPAEIQAILEQVRATVRKAAPRATETIKYDMPTFVLNGHLVYFGAFKKHLGFFPAPQGVEGFEELDDYKQGKGSVQFPYDRPMPLKLITKIVRYRVQQDTDKAALKTLAKEKAAAKKSPRNG